MTQTPYVFNQLCSCLDRDYFECLVRRYNGNGHIKTFSCWNHLLAMLWAQLTNRRSLRDIEFSLLSHRDKLYRMGIGRDVSRNTLANANATRNVAIYREFAQHMMRDVAGLPVCNRELESIAREFSLTGLFAGDSTKIYLPLEHYTWTVSQRNQGGIKVHTLYDLLRHVPLLALITGHEERDQTFMEDYPYKSGALYVFDRAYVKARSLYYIHQKGAWFVVRLKSGMKYEVLSENAEKLDGTVMGDKTIRFTSRWASQGYPEKLRLVQYYSPEKNEVLLFITNNTELFADHVALCYRHRWEIELFFKWIKQHLCIDHFYGTSANAVMLQGYVAVIAYCMLAKMASRLQFEVHAYEFNRLLGTVLTDKKMALGYYRGIQNAK